MWPASEGCVALGTLLGEAPWESPREPFGGPRETWIVGVGGIEGRERGRRRVVTANKLGACWIVRSQALGAEFTFNSINSKWNQIAVCLLIKEHLFLKCLVNTLYVGKPYHAKWFLQYLKLEENRLPYIIALKVA